MSSLDSPRAKDVLRALERLEVAACSPDGFIRVTVGARGDLRDLRLDPRALRQPDAAALARSVLRTAADAAARAATGAGELARPLTNRRPGEPVDAMVDPLLAHFDRRLGRAPAPPRLDGRPLIAEPDLAALRTALLRLRAAAATAVSPDGLITATAGGRGELTGLELDGRVLRRSDSRWLATAIVTTYREAVRKVTADARPVR